MTTSAPGRLRHRAEFVAVAKGARVNSRCFALQARPHGGAEGPRLGITVTKRVGGAVERNRIRRRLREAARAAFRATPPLALDYVIVARRAALEAGYASLIDELAAALRRAPAKAAALGAPMGKRNG